MLNFAKDLAAALDALRRHAILFLLGVTIVALALLARSWLDAHDASLRLQATLAAQQKTITEADQRQSTRDAQLTQTLAQITAAKQKVQSPTQAAAALTQAIPQLIAGEPGGKPLPSPITIELPSASQKGSSAQQTPSELQPGIATQTSASIAPTNSPLQTVGSALARLAAQENDPPEAAANSKANLPPAIIRVPQEDLKPLYDAVEDCQACAAKLAAAQGDLSDEKTKFAAATAQRDAAISAARGTFWKRARTAAKWIAIGAVAGAVLARYH